MPRGKRSTPTLTEVNEIPKNTRRSTYAVLVESFVASDMKMAKVEGVKPSAIVSVKKAIANLNVTNIEAVTANGEIYLSKK
jgi:hypothetical protein